MIIKSYEINKIDLKNNKNILIYGPNEGGKQEAIKKLLDKSKIQSKIKFDEKAILDNNGFFSMKYLINPYLKVKKLFKLIGQQINYLKF